jgi:hypothetical protein
MAAMNKPHNERAFTEREEMAYLRRELKKYEASIDGLTPDERKGLRDWVAAGNSPYDNPYYYAGDDGGPLCFIETMRLVEDMRNFPENYSYCPEHPEAYLYPFYDPRYQCSPNNPEAGMF